MTTSDWPLAAGVPRDDGFKTSKQRNGMPRQTTRGTERSPILYSMTTQSPALDLRAMAEIGKTPEGIMVVRKRV